MSNHTESLGYIKCYSSKSPKPVKSKNNKKQVETKDTSLISNPSQNLAILFNQFSSTRPEINDDLHNVGNFNYYSINDIK